MNVEIMDAHDRRAGATWRTLEKQNTCFFLSWQWIEHWLSALPTTHTPMLAIFRRAGTPVAAAMFGRRRIVRHRASHDGPRSAPTCARHHPKTVDRPDIAL